MTRRLLRRDEFVAVGEQTPRWVVLDPKPVEGQVWLFNCVTKANEHKPLGELVAAVVNGELLHKQAHMPRISVAAQHDPRVLHATAQALEALRRIEQIKRKEGVSFAKAYRYALESLSDEKAKQFPPRSTVYRYAKARRNGQPVFRGHANKGNRVPRYGKEVNEYIRDTIRTEYLVEGSPWTLRTLTELINDVAIERGWISRKERINRSYVSKNIRAEDVDPESARMDPKDVSAAKSIANNRILVTRPLERVEQDGLHLPLAAMTPHGPSTNIWLVHAIDCGLSLPAGWALCIGAPTAWDGLRCAESIIFPKAPRFAALGISEMVHIDFYGIPSKVAYDNGAEARNERMHRLVELGADVEHLESRKPQKKPFIESLNASLKRAIETFPGSTRMDGVDGQRDPIALGDKLMTLEELERRIVLWYYTDWARNALERFRFDEFEILGNLGKTPEKRWARMTGELAFPTPMPPSMTEWRNVLYKHEVRKLNRKTGITYAGFNYRLHNLTYLIQTVGETEVKVLVDPDDYRQVFVDLGDEGPLIPLTEEHVDEATPAYSLSQAIARRAEQTPDEEDEEMRRQSRLEKHKFVAESRTQARRPRKSKAQRNREVADKTKEDRAVKTASVKPLQTHSPALNSGSPTEESTPSYDAYDDVAPLPVLNRRDGGAR